MLEGQTFPEVFPDYTVPDNLKYILSNAVVSKVVMKQQKRQLVIHLKSEHIIQRKVLNKLLTISKRSCLERPLFLFHLMIRMSYPQLIH